MANGYRWRWAALIVAVGFVASVVPGPALAKGKLIGTMTGTLEPILGATGGAPIQATATFAAKCLVQ